MKNQKKGKIKRSFPIKSSFRDPNGSLYEKVGVLYRKIAPSYREHYEYGRKSGFFAAAMKEGLLVPHREAGPDLLVPERIPFISYPYEWCFSQLKDAALLTLEIQKRALEFGMILKDASAYNVQFLRGKPIFIDTLSFEKYTEGAPWLGYRQFCQHFLGPLLLMRYKDLRLNRLSGVFIDGLSLNLASQLLPKTTFLKPLALFHLHLHAKSQQKFAEKRELPKWRVSKQNLLALVDNLESSVSRLALKRQKTEWHDYYEKTNYSETAFQGKKRIIGEFLEKLNPKTVWDLGANTGEFSRLAGERGVATIAFDIDPLAIEESYSEVKRKGERNLLPLVMDFSNPSPGIGWDNRERMSLSERGPADLVMALALIHHLAISNNVPLRMAAEYFSKLGKNLIVEFIPKTDSQVQKLLATRKDIFPHYGQKPFEKEFSHYLTIKRRVAIADSERILYLMRKRG